MKLTQRNFFKKQTIELNDSKIHISTNFFGNKNEFDIDYKSIYPNKYEIKKNNFILFLLSAFFYLLAGAVYYWRFIDNDKTIEEEAFIIWFIIATTSLFVALNSTEKYWKINIANNQFIKIYKNSPNKNEVNKFIDELFEKRNHNLKSLYGYINSNLNYENQYNNFLWLQNMEVISNKEFEDKLNELNSIFGKQTNKIGF